MSSAPWTQTAHMRWAPELRFYEHQAGVLRRLKDEGMLTAFRMREAVAGAQLGDSSHEIDFTPRGLTAKIWSRNGDPERVHRAVEIILEVLQPSTLAPPQVAFEHVEPLSYTYDDARRMALESLFGSAEIGPVVMGDFANLIDGVVAEPAATLAAEYGVVEGAELRGRLTRLVGRAGLSADPGLSVPRESAPPPTALADLPPVALYVDANWTLVDRIPDDDALDGFIQAWDACRQVSESFAEALEQELFGPSANREDVGS